MGPALPDWSEEKTTRKDRGSGVWGVGTRRKGRKDNQRSS